MAAGPSRLPTRMINQWQGTAEEDLSRTKEAFRDFLYRAVHDLREPLRAISASSEILARNVTDRTDESSSQCLRHIREGADRMDLLLRDIARYCEGDGQSLQLAEIRLDSALEEAKRQISDELKKSGTVLTYDPLPMVTGDFLALAAVFRNLLENACKFHGPMPPCVHVAASKQGSEWIVAVRDNGVGFKPIYADVIFQPFKRLHGRQFRGSGLGLALTKRILDQHGGRIWAESLPGEGSTFWFSLPVSVGENA